MTRTPVTLSHLSFSMRLPSYGRSYSLQLPSFHSIEMGNKDNDRRLEWAGVWSAEIGMCIEFSLDISNINAVRAWGYLHCKCRNVDWFFHLNGGQNKLVEVLLSTSRCLCWVALWRWQMCSCIVNSGKYLTRQWNLKFFLWTGINVNLDM